MKIYIQEVVGSRQTHGHLGSRHTYLPERIVPWPMCAGEPLTGEWARGGKARGHRKESSSRPSFTSIFFFF